jgi:Xaa-Pro aminopeptidase
VNLRAIQEALSGLAIDAWLFFDHHRRDPLAYRILELPETVLPTRRWYYLVPAHGEARKLVHRIEPHVLDSLPGTQSLYARWQEHEAELCKMLRGLRRVAMQYSPRCQVPYVAHVDAGTWELVRSCGVEVVSSADLVQIFDAALTAEQMETHLEAGRRVDRIRRAAFQEVAGALSENRRLSEWEMCCWLREAFEREGLVTDHGPIVAVNAHASDPHYEPSAARSARITRGDVVLMDMWAKLKQPRAVYYDITWSGVAASAPPPQVSEVFAAVCKARDSAIAKIAESIGRGQRLKGWEVDDAARSVIDAAGYGAFFIHRTGHSIGVEVHGTGANMDNYETHDERQIVPGACFSIEPGIYLPEFGIRSEVNVLVRPGQAQVTGEIQRELVILC